jgi:hypothetical protein
VSFSVLLPQTNPKIKNTQQPCKSPLEFPGLNAPGVKTAKVDAYKTLFMCEKQAKVEGGKYKNEHVGERKQKVENCVNFKAQAT